VSLKIIELHDQLGGFIIDEVVVEDEKFNLLFVGIGPVRLG
jgi:hypothetical protein